MNTERELGVKPEVYNNRLGQLVGEDFVLNKTDHWAWNEKWFKSTLLSIGGGLLIVAVVYYLVWLVYRFEFSYVVGIGISGCVLWVQDSLFQMIHMERLQDELNGVLLNEEKEKLALLYKVGKEWLPNPDGSQPENGLVMNEKDWIEGMLDKRKRDYDNGIVPIEIKRSLSDEEVMNILKALDVEESKAEAEIFEGLNDEEAKEFDDFMGRENQALSQGELDVLRDYIRDNKNEKLKKAGQKLLDFLIRYDSPQ